MTSLNDLASEYAMQPYEIRRLAELDANTVDLDDNAEKFVRDLLDHTDADGVYHDPADEPDPMADPEPTVTLTGSALDMADSLSAVGLGDRATLAYDGGVTFQVYAPDDTPTDVTVTQVGQTWVARRPGGALYEGHDEDACAAAVAAAVRQPR